MGLVKMAQGAARVLFAAALLWACEVIWLAELGSPLEPSRLALAAAALVSLVAAAELGLGAVARLAGRLPRPGLELVFALLALPFALPAARSLFSGGFIREVRGVELLVLGFAAALVAGTALAAHVFRRLSRGPRPRRLPGLAAVAGLLALGWVDTHLQVGLYPAAHLLLGAACVALAALAARLLGRALEPSRAAAAALVALVAAAPVATALSWNSVAMMGLVENSHALLPKLRAAAVAGARLGGRERPTAVGEPLEVDAAEFRLLATSHPELDRTRRRLRHVVFVLVDAMRDDYVGLERGGASLTPFLDAWQAELVRIGTAYSASDRTGRSMPSLMTSLPFPVVSRLAALEVPLRTWLEELREAGFLTYANGNCDYVNRKFEQIRVAHCFGAEVVGERRRNDADRVEQLLEFFEENRERPIAAYTHWSSLHVKRAYGDIRAIYEQEVRRADAHLARLVGGLRRLGVYDETLVVVTADHGYSLGEGNRFLSNQCCFEEQMRVPLLLRIPGSSRGGVRLAVAASGTDVVPTLLDLLAPDTAMTLGGWSLLPFLYADPAAGAEREAFAATGGQAMLRRGRYKLVSRRDRDSQVVYDLEADPAEIEFARERAVLRELEAQLAREYERQARLAAVLVSERYPGVPLEILARLHAEELRTEEAQALLTGWWDRKPPVREEILRSLVLHDRREVAALLDGLARPGRWEDEDQILLVMRAWAGVDGSCAELDRRRSDLGGEARRWLAETLDAQPRSCMEQLRPGLAKEIDGIWSAAPGLDSADGEYAALVAHALVSRLGSDTDRRTKEILGDAATRLGAGRGRYGIPSWRRGRLEQREMLWALSQAVRADEFDLLDALPWTPEVAGTMAAACGQLDDAGCKARLLRLLDEREGVRAFQAMLKEFDRYRDAEFRRQASARIRARYPSFRSIE